MKKLSELPNIGSGLEKQLMNAGILDAGDLYADGSENAFIKLFTIDNSCCINMLYALEGAVQGIRWHKIDNVRKKQLIDFFRRLKQAG